MSPSPKKSDAKKMGTPVPIKSRSVVNVSSMGALADPVKAELKGIGITTQIGWESLRSALFQSVAEDPKSHPVINAILGMVVHYGIFAEAMTGSVVKVLKSFGQQGDGYLVYVGIQFWRIMAHRSGALIGVSFDRSEDSVKLTKRTRTKTFNITVPRWAKCTLVRELNGREVTFTRVRYGVEAAKASPVWSDQGDHMTFKVVEADAYRMAFPVYSVPVETPARIVETGPDTAPIVVAAEYESGEDVEQEVSQGQMADAELEESGVPHHSNISEPVGMMAPMQTAPNAVSSRQGIQPAKPVEPPPETPPTASDPEPQPEAEPEPQEQTITPDEYDF